MIIVRATQKLLNTQRIKPENIDLQDTPITTLGQWYANTVTSSFKGKSLVIYVHYDSLITVITTGKTIKKTFPEFEKRLKNLLTRFSFPEAFINEQMAAFDSPLITKTNSRKMLAQMNGITDQLIYRMYTYESFEEIDLEEEENILMHYLHGNAPTNFFTPTNYWSNYLIGEDPIGNFNASSAETDLIKLKHDDTKLSRSENLHMENQLMKLQIEDILGGQIMNGSSSEIPAEIENIFLKNIIEFEKQAKASKQITVFEVLGKPKFKPAESLTEKQLKSELNKANILLNKKYIQLDFLAKYSDLVKYKFITEELMKHETQSLNMPGMITHFIYEEFHPNHEFDIKNKLKHFIYNLLDPELEAGNFKYTCNQNFILNRKPITLEQLDEKVKYFHLITNTDEVMDYRKKEITFNKDQTKARVIGQLELKKEGTKAKTKIPMNFNLVCTHDWWEIIGLDFEMLS